MIREAVDAYVARQQSKHGITGASVAIVKDGEVVHCKGYGLANIEHSVPATEQTVYQIASVTKPFTAAAVMMLVEEGLIALTDPITDRIADLPPAWQAVTIRHLLDHTSGIKSYTSLPDLESRSRRDHSPREVIDLVAGEPLEFTPGDEFRYNNTGYFLLGMLIEQISGKTYSEFLHERIFQPLGMTQTRLNDLSAIIPHRAQGYSLKGMEMRNGDYVSPTLPFAAGALVSSVMDLVKWDEALHSERVLSKASLDRIWTPATLNDGKTVDYGLGWQIAEVNGHRLRGHTGGIPGFATRFVCFPDDQLTVIMFSNSDHCDATTFAQGIASQVIPHLAPQPAPTIEDTAPEITARLKTFIQDALAGKPVLDQLTEEMKQSPATHLMLLQAQHVPFGNLKELALQSSEDGALRYRAIFENESAVMAFQLDDTGKIAGIGLRREY
jgi:CubicO group peptidase (beta-lactamase class C family)